MEKKYLFIDFSEADSKLRSAVVEAIKASFDRGFSYEEVYTALHKMIDMAMYEWEVDEILP